MNKIAAVILSLLFCAGSVSAQAQAPGGLIGYVPASGSSGSASSQAGYAQGAGPDIGALGSELTTNSSFATDLTGWTGTNWAFLAGGKAQHTAGSTSPLAQDITVTSGRYYFIAITISSRTAGTVAPAIGAVTTNVAFVATTTTGTASWILQAAATGSVSFAITPTSAFDGNVDDVSVKEITGRATVFDMRDSTATSFAPMVGAASKHDYGVGLGVLRFNSGINNQGVGYGSLGSNTSGTYNMALGYFALGSNTTGTQNVAIGGLALYQSTIASNNVAIGMQALEKSTLGASNVAMGFKALNQGTIGSQNVALGSTACQQCTTANNNTGVGDGALYAAAGNVGNATTTGGNNTSIGAQSGQGSSSQRTNSSALGYQATYDADNWVTLGNGSVTDVSLGGSTGLAWGVTKKGFRGSTNKALTDAAAAAAVWRCTIPTAGFLGGEVLWTTQSSDGTDHRATQGSVRFAGVNKAGTATCTINVIGTDLTASSNGNTLVCTWTNVVSGANCDLSVTCTDNTGGSQSMSVNSRLDTPIVTACTPQ